TLAYICGWNGRILKSHNDISAVHTALPGGFEISAFPNPFADELNIVIDLQKNSPVKISVTDIAERIVLEENEGELNSGKQVIHPAGISSLVSGMYFLKVISENGEMSIPVVKQ
ncbi:MAG TPA: T9SS type A sorting domain-containing protein, partial [Bacteroidia bacterium]|nr:T9SS type A sorting domain-containing protein [Bacteroidia bacterium]